MYLPSTTSRDLDSSLHNHNIGFTLVMMSTTVASAYGARLCRSPPVQSRITRYTSLSDSNVSIAPAGSSRKACLHTRERVQQSSQQVILASCGDGHTQLLRVLSDGMTLRHETVSRLFANPSPNRETPSTQGAWVEGNDDTRDAWRGID